MDPITPYSERIDLRTEHGRKIYEACTKAVPVVFDAVAGKHHAFITALRNIAGERCWREICLIPVGNQPNIVTYDLLTHPGKISMAVLQTHCSAIWNEKQVEGKMFWWCTGRDGKHHKPMFCRHKPQDCVEQEKEKPKKVSVPNDVADNKSKTAAPKLKLNNNLATHWQHLMEF